MMKLKYVVILILFIVLAGLLLAACGSGDDGESESESESLDSNIVTIATGGASGPYNIIATTLADIYTNTYDVNSRTQTTGASAENLNLMAEEKVEMAFVMSDALSRVKWGRELFRTIRRHFPDCELISECGSNRCQG